MTEADLEDKLANWKGAQTADYGAICNDLAQLKLNKVPVRSTIACRVHHVLSAMSVSQDRDDTHCSTFLQANHTTQLRCPCWLVQGAMAEAQQLFQQALAVTEAGQTQAEEGSASEDDWESSKLPC